MEERLIKYLPFAGGLLIFLGVLKITIYYQYFSISILPYLSLSDVLLLFLNDLNTVLAVAVIGAIHLMASGEVFESVGLIFDAVILRFRKYYIIFFGITCAALSTLVGLDIIGIAIWNIYLIIFLAIQFLTFVFMKRSVDIETGLPEIDFRANNLLKLLIILIIIAMIPLLSIKDIREIKESKENVVLYMSDGQKASNSETTYYLGKAGEYHFFYDSKKRESTTVRNSDVKSIEKHNP